LENWYYLGHPHRLNARAWASKDRSQKNA